MITALLLCALQGEHVMTHLDAGDLGSAVGTIDDQARDGLASDEVQVRAVLDALVVRLPCRGASHCRWVDVVRAVEATDGRLGLVLGGSEAKLGSGINDVL